MTVDYDGVILGGTVQGREAAALAARHGARVALVEPPGDVDRQIRRQILLMALAQGGALSPVPWESLKHRVKSLETVAYPHLSFDWLATSGVDLVLEPGQFSPRPRLAVTTATRRLRSRRYLLAPGTQVTVPAIPGLATTPYLTLDTLLELEALPDAAIVLGRSSGAIALAQSLAQLGTHTTLVSRGNALLPTEDPDISTFIAGLLEAAGVVLQLGARLGAIDYMNDQAGFKLSLADGDVLTSPVLILATALHPALEGLNLTSIGVQPRIAQGVPTALPVNDHLATTHPRVYACGPALGGYWAETTDHQDVAIALGNALYLPVRKMAWMHRPAMLSTTPGYARIGFTVTQAQRWYGSEATVVQVPFGSVLQSHRLGDITGICRWIVHRNGQLLGAHICGPGAEELIQTMALAIHQGIPLQRLERLPTLPPSLGAMVPCLVQEWQRQRWQPGTWRRDWAENWFNWQRTRRQQ